MAVFAPLLIPTSPFTLSLQRFHEPSSGHPMGTDDLGRDIMCQVILGSRTSLFVGLTAAITATAFGGIIGAASGYFGGWMDDVLMRFTDMFLITPRFLLALVIAAIIGPSIWNVIFVIAVLSWPSTARIIRAEYLRIKEMEFVESSRALGSTTGSIIFKIILPNAINPVITNGTLQIASAILLEASLSFLGLSDPSLFSWGRTLYNAQGFLDIAWWMSIFPGLAIFLTVLGFNLLGDALSDALNPKSKQGVRTTSG
jgi:peptide/nickel transport system permease protein